MSGFSPSGSTATEIANSIERGIREGDLAQGDFLPSVRQLGTRLRLSPATVASAYRMLRDRGFVTTRERGRTRVSTRPPLVPRAGFPVPDSAHDLASGNPDPELLPPLVDTLDRLKPPLKMYGDAAVLPELRALAQEQLGLGPSVSDDLVVVNGGLDGVERILMAHLRPGDRVAVEDPSYVGITDLMRAMNLRPQPVLIDQFGQLPAALDAALAAGAQAVIITPRCQNPTGAALNPDRAAELREVLAGYPSVLVLEDDHAGGTTSHPRHSVISERARWAVVHSVAKSLGPDLRLAVMVGDTLTVGRVEGRQMVGCGWVSHVLQALVASLWRDQGVRRALNRAAATYDERRDALVNALAAQSIPAVGRSGFNVWVPVDDEESVVRGLLHLGWAVRGGEPYRFESGPGIRVTTAALRPEDAQAFAADLAQVLSPRQRTRLA